MLWDSHLHSSFSGDSDALPTDIIKSAKSKGLYGIAFTDHLDIDYPKELGNFDLDLNMYFQSLRSLAYKNSDDRFTVLVGLEIGLTPHIANKCKKAVKSNPFDFIIGSTHLIDGYDPYFKEFWETGEEKALLNRYYEAIYENITAFHDFDSLGHLDYAFRYAPSDSTKSNTHTPYFDIIDAILEFIVKKDIALEVNTAFFRKGGNAPNPAPSIIKRYHELGGELITIGSDAHDVSDIAADFDKLPTLMDECGFKEFAVYKKRKPILYPIS